ncbi:MAG: ribonuclease E [Moraxellaceae bacterium]|nr:MAG: ribonuclease E [Moraxellaceae bacterium]
MLAKAFAGLIRLIKRHPGRIFLALLIAFAIALVILLAGKIYQKWDDDPDRGAIAITNGAFGENYSTPIYLDQGWSESDSLWFYNTTQGSGLLPYDFFMVLEHPDSNELLRSNQSVDKFRYLPQKPTFFNPDGLPVGFVKESYQGKDYVGYTCAACHTGQVNYQGKAIRIDGGPAMADMVGFLTTLEKGLKAARDDAAKRDRFVKGVLELDNSYSDAEEIDADLKKFTDVIELYNTINHSHIDYGYARLDAFGRIYNRVLEHVINREQLKLVLMQVNDANGDRLISEKQVDAVLAGVNETIIGDVQFAQTIHRLQSKEGDYPGLNPRDMLRIRNAIFNEANAPVSYPFLWDIVQSDYVQWNGLAENSGVGPLGRNMGEVIGVFGILDWTSQDAWSLSKLITGERGKKQAIDFKSSMDLTNLGRLEFHLTSLKSPQWPEEIFGKIDYTKARRGQLLYNEYCASCHQVVQRDDASRLIVGKMSNIDIVGTDPKMAQNSVNYTGYAGNFNAVYQGTDVGNVVIQNRAPVIQVLTAATKGAVATPDADKNFVRRGADWAYMIGKSFFDNKIKPSVKSGNYKADTTANPYQSLLSYKARSLNGIWATAPYLHNGSVPDLYSLLLPKKRDGDPAEGQYRPNEFVVGSREFDPVKIGLKSEGYDGFNFKAIRVGDLNIGHEYGVGRSPESEGKTLPAITEQERWDLIEYIKTL